MPTNEEFRAELKEVKCLLLDLDGTLYQEDRLFNSTLDFLSDLDKQQIQKVYATRVEPIVIGKPYAPFIDGLLNKLSEGNEGDFDLRSLAIMGDRLYTDIDV